ncbi:MAG TPA: YHS domain-containing (seleno)protein [Panacibacter sp.]|nr:YHS domain-containing (seleno)protein [Panacibacter sp.]
MKKAMLLLAITWFSVAVFAQKSEVFINKGYAVNGYDVVAYFNKAKSVEGKKTYLYQWHNAYWLFSTKQNLDSFSHNPEKYAPQFGGYCAYGVSEGHKASTEPDAWTIVDGKLYLNYNKDVQQLWKKDIPGKIKKAEENWVKVKDTE